MPARRQAMMALLGLVALAALRVALLWTRLPPTLASHFGPSGRPNGWMPRTDFLLLFGGTFAFVSLTLFAVPALIEKFPGLVNVPHREYWLAPERRKETADKVGTWLSWFAVALVAFAFAVLELTLRANLDGAPLDDGLFVVALVAFLAFTLAWTVGLFRAFRVPG